MKSLRKLLYIVLKMGGCPTRIITAYANYMSNLQIYNMVAGTLGKGHNHECGIPQGCPLSMMLIVFLLRPWIIIMKTLNATPRILADDILVFAEGHDHEQKFKQAFEATHIFLADIGARLAPSKSTTFSTEKSTRKKLKSHIWATTGTNIKLIIHARDLGSHLCTTGTMCGPTLTARLKEATALIKRIGRTNFTKKIKIHLIRTSGISKALYGIEATPACERTMQGLRAAIANVIGPHSRTRSVELAFATAGQGKDLDPDITGVVRRSTMLRRMLIKHPEHITTAHKIWELYKVAKHPGTQYDHATLKGKNPIPLFGKSGRNKGKPEYNRSGQVGFSSNPFILWVQVFRATSAFIWPTNRRLTC